MNKNPFYLTVLPVDAPFCGREKEIDKLVNRSNSGDHCVILSPRRYGKTSLIVRVQDKLQQQGIISIYTDVSGAAGADEFAKRLAHGIYTHLSKKKSLFDRVKKFFTGWTTVQIGTSGIGLTLQPVSQKSGFSLLEETMESFDSFLKNNKSVRFNIAFDEFQDIADFSDGSKVEALLRRYIQHQTNCSYFFLGSRRRVLQDMFNQKSRPFYNIALKEELAPLPEKRAVPFLIHQFANGEKSCPEQIAKQIVKITNCYPYYIQRLGHSIFEIAEDEHITEAHFTKGLSKMLAEEEASFRTIETALAQGQKKFLKALALEPTPKPFANAYTQRHLLGSRTALKNALKKLEGLDHVEKSKDEYYRLTDPVFALWLNKVQLLPVPDYNSDYQSGQHPSSQTAYHSEKGNINDKIPETLPEHNMTAQRTQKTLERSIAEIPGYKSKEFTRPRAELPEPPNVQKNSKKRPQIKLFLSYAHADKQLKGKLFDILRDRLKTSKAYNFTFSDKREFVIWSDEEISPCENWDNEIQEKLAQCDFGLMLLSSAFLASKYIMETEVSILLKYDKCLPVALRNIDIERQYLKGIEARQIFFYEDRAFNEIPREKIDRFINSLAKKIEDRVEKYLLKKQEAINTPKTDSLEIAVSDEMAVWENCAKYNPTTSDEDILYGDTLKGKGNILTKQQIKYHKSLYKYENFIETKGCSGTIGAEIEKHEESTGDTVDALDYIKNWALDLSADAPPYFVLLGDYGTGKTFTCRMLTRYLEAKHKKEPNNYPYCIYIDLHTAITRIGDDKKIPDLKSILQSAIDKTKDPLESATAAPEDIIRLVRQGALIIYDGLDEKTVHFSKEESGEFFAELLKIRDFNAKENEHQGKILISCRSHYFRDSFEQSSLFLEKDRHGQQSANYRACELLPFETEQIKQYFQKVLDCSKEETIGMEKLLESVHNLKDLAKRPYLLSLLTEHIPDLQDRKEQDRTINSAALYELTIQRWLGRDQGKHKFNTSHKQALMKDLALEIHKGAGHPINVDKLENWLDEWLLQNPVITAAYSHFTRETLKKDLRTATFIIRAGDKDFSFAHKSLQEYFLACYLADAVIEDRPESWAIAPPSIETFSFLAEILTLGQEELAEQGDDKDLKQIMNKWRISYRTQTSELLLHYTLHAYKIKAPEDTPRALLSGWDLKNAKLVDLEIIAPENEKWNLMACDFSGADLRRARFKRLRLDNCQFTESKLNIARFLDCTANSANFDDADLTGTIFRNNFQNFYADLKEKKKAVWNNCNFRSPNCHRTQWLTPGIQGRYVYLNCKFNEYLPIGATFAPIESVKLKNKKLEWIKGHSGNINSCGYSPDGRFIVSASQDDTLKIWDARTGEVLLSFTAHRDEVRSFAYSPDERFIVSASWDNTLKTWDVHKGKKLRTLKKHKNRVNSCSYCPNGDYIASTSYDKTLIIWDADNGESLRTLKGHEDEVTTCAYSTDGHYIASGSSDSTLKIWGAHNGECLHTLKGHEDEVTTCAYSPDGRYIASGSGDNTLKIWDAHNGECLLTFKEHKAGITSCSYSQDGEMLISSSWDGTIKIWNSLIGECFYTLKGQNGTLSCSYNPHKQYVASAGTDNRVSIWDINTNRQLLSTKPQNKIYSNVCAYSSDGRYIASANHDNTLRIWDTHTDKYLISLIGHENTVESCTYSPDGRCIVSVSRDYTVRIWNAHTGKCLHTLKGLKKGANDCAYNPDGKSIILASDNRLLSVWDAHTWKCLFILKGHKDFVEYCAYSPNGKYIVSGSGDNTVKIWDAHTGECLFTLKGHDGAVMACVYSPDSSNIVSGSLDHTLRIWDANTGNCLSILKEHEDEVTSCAYSPDGKSIVSGSSDSTIKIWNAETGKCLRTLKGHEIVVTSCRYSPDGEYIVSTSWDNTIKFWNPKTGDCLKTYYYNSPEEWAVIDHKANKVLNCGPEAWQHLAWLAPDAEGRITRFPFEIEM